MEPTAEQLIRDYLNRLSVAARTRLRSDDRRAFLARTREFLERRSAEPGADDDGGVLDALATLGEPVAAVENEYARLVAERRKRAATRSGLWRPRGSRSGEPEASAGDADAGPDSDGGPDPGQVPATASGSRRAPVPGHVPRAAVDVSHLDEDKLKGDIEKKVKVNRPLSSRWRPGAPVKERPVRSYRVPRPRAGGSQPGKGSQAAPGAADDLQGDGSRPEAAVAGGPPAAGAQSAGPQTGPGTLAGPEEAGPSPAGPYGPWAIDLRPADPPPGAQPPAGPASPTLASGGGSPASVLPGDWLSGSRPGAGTPGAATPEPASPEPASPEAGAPASASPDSDNGTAGPAPSKAGGVRASATRPARVVTSRLPAVQLPELSGVGRGIAARVARFTRQHRLETAAVVLMILCGLIYPLFSWVLGFSLWLLGAILAAASRQWSLWEKWAGLLGPVVLVIAGTSVGLALGGHHHTVAPYVHEVLADSRVMIKISAVLGAVYLAWRAHRGPTFAVPPWNR
jgi:hypothetical protein